MDIACSSSKQRVSGNIYGPFAHFDMLPPPEIMEQKLAAQHVEMQRLGAVTSEREQQMRSLMDKIAKMEAELQAAEPIKNGCGSLSEMKKQKSS
ncbi:hypothetical protein GOBAR_DD35707 [Gossypium barbadense]|nr:hypothetical protein GOBAR_DD35707 [Gossypium barbadense]